LFPGNDSADEESTGRVCVQSRHAESVTSPVETKMGRPRRPLTAHRRAAIHTDKTGAINHLIRHIQESKYKVLESPAEKKF
jgi:hypothetical protein